MRHLASSSWLTTWRYLEILSSKRGSLCSSWSRAGRKSTRPRESMTLCRERKAIHPPCKTIKAACGLILEPHSTWQTILTEVKTKTNFRNKTLADRRYFLILSGTDWRLLKREQTSNLCLDSRKKYWKGPLRSRWTDKRQQRLYLRRLVFTCCNRVGPRLSCECRRRRSNNLANYPWAVVWRAN